MVVVSESGTDNATACWSGVSGECSNLTMHSKALVAIPLLLSSAVRTRYDVLLTMSSTKLKNVVISGLAPAGKVAVNCSDGAGLTFLQSATVNISNVSFYGCGYEHASNSRINMASKFAQYKVALFFQLCTNVTLNRVEVSYSKGIAVQFFATIGNNEIQLFLVLPIQVQMKLSVGERHRLSHIFLSKF